MCSCREQHSPRSCCQHKLRKQLYCSYFYKLPLCAAKVNHKLITASCPRPCSCWSLAWWLLEVWGESFICSINLSPDIHLHWPSCFFQQAHPLLSRCSERVIWPVTRWFLKGGGGILRWGYQINGLNFRSIRKVRGWGECGQIAKIPLCAVYYSMWPQLREDGLRRWCLYGHFYSDELDV